MKSLSLFNSLILLFLIMMFSGLLACNSQSNEVQGYVGVENRSIDGGVKTPQSNLIFMATDTNVLSVVEGNEIKILIQLSRPVPRDTTVTWSLENADKDFLINTEKVNLQKDMESFEVTIKSIADSLYQGDRSFNFKLVGDTTVFFSSLLVSLLVKEVQPLPVVSFETFKETVSEGTASYPVHVNLSQASIYTTKVKFTAEGTAKDNRIDYYLSDKGYIVFNPGETQKNLIVYPTDDSLSNGTRDILFKLTEVSQGLAIIDTFNSENRFFIEDNDSTSLFNVRGVTGGTDTLIDDFLTSGNQATVYWSDTPYESGFKVSILALNGSTVICPEVVLPADTLSYAFTGCTLNEGSFYRVHILATVEGIDKAPGNQNYLFKVDTIPPDVFYILGAFGGKDIVPDKFLAGTLIPSIAWTDSVGEAYYNVSIWNLSDTADVCPVQRVPANVTAYTFTDCILSPNTDYLVKVTAYDSAGNSIVSGNNVPLTFLVTEVPAGYLIKGVTGGTADISYDENMDDGADPVVTWEPIEGATSFEVSILNMNNTDRCTLPGSVPGNQTSATFTNCSLFLHDQYKVKVLAYDVNNIQYPAANSPFVFRYRVGLFISGSGGSYYRGLPIYDCGGSGDICNSATPFVLKEDIDEKHIRVSNNGVLTGLPWASLSPATKNGYLKISADYLKIDSNGKISMSGRGYTSSNGPGKGYDANPASGAAHGGNGSYVIAPNQGHAYDSVKIPSDAGSGGGTNGANSGGTGGGILEITVRENLEFMVGTINSDGDTAPGVNAGGGAGGSLILRTKNLSGAGGTIRANGGAGNGAGGPGSGGRVAIYYTNLTHSGGLNGISLAAKGGATGSSAGTVFYKADADTEGYLLLDNGSYPHTQGVETPIPLADSFNDIYTRNYGTFIIESADTYTSLSATINYRLVIEGVLILLANNPHLTIGTSGWIEWRRADPFDDWSQITINRGGVLTHSYNSNAQTYILDIQAASLDIYGSINVSGRGYGAALGPSLATGGFGASYGGMGGYHSTGVAGSSYGSVKNPNEMGSGGGGAAGGGYIKINLTGDLTLAGSIRANGSFGCGGGSGGSIHITATNITGTGGAISAAGGDGDVCGGGGGGRVALYYQNTTYLGGIEGINFEIFGGWANVHGAAGTVFYKKTGGALPDIEGHLLVLNATRNYDQSVTTNIIDPTQKFDSISTDFRGTLKILNGTSFELPSNSISYRIVDEGTMVLPGAQTELIVALGGYLELRKNTALNYNKITVEQGGVITHSYNFSSRNYIVYLQANDLVIRGQIDASYRGYDTDQGPGKPAQVKLGAGYGGYGGNGGLYTLLEGGPAYDIDKIKAPVELGSASLSNGSGASLAWGARGGGAVRLEVANKLTLNGFIKADGLSGNINSNIMTGGGSGGSIFITTNIIEGSGGSITANGGNGQVYGSSSPLTYSFNGSGGRIAIIYTTDNYASGLKIKSLVDYEKITAFGGTYYDNRVAAAGTIFLKHVGVDTDGRLYYNNGPHSYAQKMETPIHTVGGISVDSFVTMNKATLLVPGGHTFTLPSSIQDYRMVVEGTLVIPGAAPGVLTIAKGGYLEWRKSTLLDLDELTIQNGGVLSHSYNYDTKAYFLNVHSRLVTVEGGGAIDVSGRGFQPTKGTGTGCGAAYGGKTMTGATIKERFPYGSYNLPTDLGSGGDSGSITSGGGGGYLKLFVDSTLTVNGLISSDGYSYNGCGASGGSIHIDTNIIKGSTATIRADGGVTSYGGSGGRIAIYYNTDQYGISTMKLTAFGGSNSAAAGTIFHKNKVSDPNGHLVIKNTGRIPNPDVTTTLPNGGAGQFIDSLIADASVYVEVPNGQSFTLPNTTISYKMLLAGDILLPGGQNTLTINNTGILELKRPAAAPAFGKTLNIFNIIVDRGGLITHSYNSSAKTYWVNLDLDDFTLNGSIDVSGRGYSSGSPGQGNINIGASHGGRGGCGTIGCGAAGYGSVSNPTSLGSASAFIVTGGGLVVLNIANSLTLNGSITANGLSGSIVDPKN